MRCIPIRCANDSRERLAEPCANRPYRCESCADAASVGLDRGNQLALLSAIQLIATSQEVMIVLREAMSFVSHVLQQSQRVRMSTETD